MKNILTVRGLHASIEGKEILRGIDFTVNAGEVHAIMGQNGSGKSTLVSLIPRLYDISRQEHVRFGDSRQPAFRSDGRYGGV